MKEFENPTSAPLIALVDTITPVPLLYHVHTLYIVRYNSPTTYRFPYTYTINELQKEKEKEPTGDKQDKKLCIYILYIHVYKQSHNQQNTIYIISLVRHLGSSWVFETKKEERYTQSNNNHSNSSIHSQHTNTSTSKQHSCF